MNPHVARLETVGDRDYQLHFTMTLKDLDIIAHMATNVLSLPYLLPSLGKSIKKSSSLCGYLRNLPSVGFQVVKTCL